jgi:hypothetical protein
MKTVRLTGPWGGLKAGATVTLQDRFADALINTHLATFVSDAGDDPDVPVTARVEPLDRAAGRSLWVYGDSDAIVPGLRCTPGREWPTVLAKALNAASMRSYAVGGSDTVEVAGHMVRGTPTNGFVAITGSLWDGTRKGICILHVGGNDSGGYTDRSTPVPVPVATDADHQAGVTGALRACLALFASASRVEVESGTLTGTWTTYTSGDQSAGNSRYTTTVGDNATFPAVTFPASGRVHLLMHAIPIGGGVNPGAATIQVDGTTVKTITAQQLSTRRVKTGANFLLSAPVAFEINASPGSHTVKVIHSGTAGAQLVVDALIIPAASPPPVLVPWEFDALPTGNWWNQTQIDLIKANREILEPLYEAVVAEFPNAHWLPMKVDTSGLSAYDGLHRNDRGMGQAVKQWLKEIGDFLTSNDPDGMYNNLAAQTPAAGSNLVSSGVWSGSGIAFPMPYRCVVYITGGTVSAVAIDGNNTGMTSGAFIVPAGHTISCTYTAAPNFLIIAMD